MQKWGTPAHLFTMSCNRAVCRAALATIEVIKEEKLIRCANDLGKY